MDTITSEHVTHVLTPLQAEAFIRKLRGKGRTLFVSVGQSAPAAGRAGYAFPVSANVQVSHKQAMKFLADAYSQVMRDKGAMCQIRTLSSCVFIGSAA